MSARRAAAAALAALLLPAAAFAQAQDGARSYKYFYEDVFEPFFALDAAAGVYRPARDGARARAFEAVKPAGTFRAFVVGGSIAGLYGEEDLRAALQALMPARAVEVVGCGMPGYDSSRERLVVEEVLGYAPDLIVLMSGHNESIAFPWLPRWKLRAAAWGRRLGAKPAPPPPQTGAQRRAALAEGLRAFEDNLRAMARASASRAVPFVVVLPPLNVRDAPSRSALPRAPWFREGWTRYLAGDCAGARAAWAAGAGAPAPDAAVAEFFSGRCLERTGRRAEAAAAYERALAVDEPLRGRCGPECRAVLERAAAEPGAVAADAESEFRAYAAPGLPGFDEFSDGVHWRPQFNALTTRAIVAALRRTPSGSALPLGEPRLPPRPAPPRTEAEWTALLRGAAAEARDHEADGVSAAAVAAFEYAAPRRGGALDAPAELERLESDSNARGRVWGMPALSVPRAAYEWAYADALRALGRTADARVAFAAAVKAGARGADFDADRGAPGRGGAGESSAAGPAPAGAEASTSARRALCREPMSGAERIVACARAELAEGDRAAAAASARAALASAGLAPAARRGAALVLQDAGFGAEALELFAAAAKAVPSDATAALDYGVALFGAGRRDEAIAALRKAAALETTPGDAALSLAAALDAAGSGTEAERVLREAQSRAQGKASARFAAALKERSR